MVGFLVDKEWKKERKNQLYVYVIYQKQTE